jgi:hypothetical protein
MSGISPINVQHIQQMGTATEKLQHSLQNIPHAANQEHKEERKTTDEMKRTTVQNAEQSNQSNTVNPDGTRRKKGDQKKKKGSADGEENISAQKTEASPPENGQGKTINLIV